MLLSLSHNCAESANDRERDGDADDDDDFSVPPGSHLGRRASDGGANIQLFSQHFQRMMHDSQPSSIETLHLNQVTIVVMIMVTMMMKSCRVSLVVTVMIRICSVSSYDTGNGEDLWSALV